MYAALFNIGYFKGELSDFVLSPGFNASPTNIHPRMGVQLLYFLYQNHPKDINYTNVAILLGVDLNV